MVRDYGGIVKALMGEWEKTKQPLKERATILPLGQYEDGSVGLAWPGMLADPIQRGFEAANTPIPPVNDDEAWRNKSTAMFDVASLAPLGGAAAVATGALDNAVGSAGGRLAKGAADQPQGIRAYHGSPHDFDRFSLDAIGTGEGAQAYGHGLYFADSEDVARSYRDNLGGKDVRAYGEEIPFRMGSIPEDVLSMELHRSGDIDSAIRALEKEKQFYGFIPPEEFDAVIARAQQMKADNAVEAKPKGRMYEVNIKANPEDFLDWDKPFREQPKHVQEKIEAVLAKANRGTAKLTPEDEALLAELGPMTEAEAAYDPFANLKGSNLLFSIEDRLSRPSASEVLREAGIPGIKYLDGMSRGQGEGSSNYVVFDDALIEILRKYANPVTGAIPGLAAQTQDDIDPAILEVLRSYGLIQ